MGWQDRPYNREENDTPMSAKPMYSASAWLGWTCLGIFLLDSLLLGSRRGNAFSPVYWGDFNLPDVVHHWQIWRLITFQFLHADGFHILGNLLGLLYFGPVIENYMGSRRFVLFYLICGMCSALTFSVAASVPGLLGSSTETVHHLIGASGGVYAILVGCALVAPDMIVRVLFLPISLKMRTLAKIYLAVSVFAVLLGSHNVGGETAHLGGAAMGFIFIKIPSLLTWTDWLNFGSKHTTEDSRYWSPQGKSKKRSRNPVTRIRGWLDARRQAAIENETKDVDRILDKVHDHGLASLTNKEKRTLQRATARKRGDE